MKIKFKDYTYIDPNSNDKGVYDFSNAENKEELRKYIFDEEKYQTLKRQNRHVEAAAYRAKYVNNDPRLAREERAQIKAYEQSARMHQAIYDKAVSSGKYDKDALEFSEHWRTTGNFGNIQGNERVDELVKLKRNIGSILDDRGDLVKEAVKLSYSFAPDKRVVFGTGERPFWSGDWLLRDNVNTLENRLNEIGYTKEELEKAGAVFDKDEDGYDRITFGKDAPFATLFMYTDAKSNKRHIGGKRRNAVITSYDSEGNVLFNGRAYKSQAAWDNFVNNNPTIGNFYNLVDLIDEAEKITDGYFTEQKNKTMQITSYDTSPIENQGDGKKYKDWVLDDIFNAGTAINYDIYTNTGIEDDKTNTDNTLRLLNDQKKRVDLMKLISGSDYDDLVVKIKSVDGVEGIAITKKATVRDPSGTNSKPTDTRGSDYKDLLLSDEITIWIPGLMPDQSSAETLYGDSHVNAMREVNHMSMYDYNYKTSRGETIIPNSYGFTVDDGENTRNISKDEAIAMVTKDMVLDDAKVDLYYEFSNADNNLFDKEGYEALAKQLAVRSANETYPNTYLLNDDGSEMSVDEIFSMRGENDVAEPYRSKMKADKYYKLLDIYDIYMELMKGLSLYR